MSEIDQQFVKWLEPLQLSLSERQLQQFRLYHDILAEWNGKMNLTAIEDTAQVYEKHFWDSLQVAGSQDMMRVTRMADIGAGAGFPSIPLKIIFPHLQLTIVDALNKRIGFLQHLVQELALQDVQPIHARAEDLAKSVEHREQYDLVSARAVARLPILVEVCVPYAKRTGTFLAMKGTTARSEVSEAGKALKELRAEASRIHAYRLPSETEDSRFIVQVVRKGDLPKKYPRNTGIPFKKPLGSQ